jgi:MEMO1 family protein
MQVIHQPAVADLFYPEDPIALTEWIQHRVIPTADIIEKTRKPRMLILPHAGYQFSGDVAAQGYKLIRQGQYRRVVVLCPAHRVYVQGIAIPARWDAEATPIGHVLLDKAAIAQLLTMPSVIAATEAHRYEHGIEVQLPFLQLQLGEFKLIPLVVGECPTEYIVAVLDQLMDEDTLAIVSSDLSHYLNQSQAREKDDETIQQILAFSTTLTGEQACGCYALNGALRWAHAQSLQIDLLAKCNSGDMGHDTTRVVGYAALTLY